MSFYIAVYADLPRLAQNSFAYVDMATLLAQEPGVYIAINVCMCDKSVVVVVVSTRQWIIHSISICSTLSSSCDITMQYTNCTCTNKQQIGNKNSNSSLSCTYLSTAAFTLPCVAVRARTLAA